MQTAYLAGGAFAVACLLTVPQPNSPTAAEIVRLTSAYREGKGLPPLKAHPVLMRVAQAHAENMARQKSMSHVLDGKGFGERGEEAGYKGGVGENIAHIPARFEPSAKAAFEQWVKSAPHRENLLDRAYQDIGVGACKTRLGDWYYCQVFGVPR